MFMKMRALPALMVLGVSAAVAGQSNAGVINHDQVVGFAESASALELQFKPTLKVEDGCVPFPAVDQYGNTSGGEAASGARNGGCSSSTGQVYSRVGTYNGLCAVMYAWYFPKDQVIAGHRHDWENIVVWLSSCSTSATVVQVSYSQHSSYEKLTTPPMNGTHPKVRYFTDGITDHTVGDTTTVGGTQPLIGWTNLTDAARTALNTTDFGSANVSMDDGNFANNLAKAR
ncbi:NPP1 family protein [Asticcacaulis solisilvae]|uniref:NPP1 family protein n=1 Tax=Asticcacaulis solisilvae TaxID=1217274 RepID=UPI003FD7ADE8